MRARNEAPLRNWRHKNRRRFENMRRRIINLPAKFRRFANGAEFAASKPHFAGGAKFTAHKFRFLQATGKFRPLQAALNFKI
ncbi:MAG: hypothetical protein D8H92_11870 [Campylobacter sp.]|nr:MAG: hypothetical protein D8H92_11870 [Campylobacter sp.]